MLAGIYSDLRMLIGRLTGPRANLLDNLDAAISSRASAASYTDARASKLDNLDQAVSAVKGWRFMLFVADGTWHCPAANTPVFVVAIGGGESGLEDGVHSAGGASSFGSIVTASGGDSSSQIGYAAGQPGTPDAIVGGQTYSYARNGSGGTGFFGIGHGGPGVAGGVGGYSGAVATYSGLVSADQTVTVGAGSAAVTVMSKGCDGAVGVWWKE